MGTLADIISDALRRRMVVKDAAVLLDDEVASKTGVAGLAIKAAFAMVKAVKPGIIPETIDGLLPEFAAAIDPILAQREPKVGIVPFVLSREKDVVNALLGVTDKRAQRTSHKTLLSAYQKLRPTAEKQVAAGLPRLSRLIDKHNAAMPPKAAPAAGA
jgi:hypothetical protein